MRTGTFLKTFIALGVLAAALVCGSLFFLATVPCFDFSVLEHYNPGKPSILLDCHGKEWGRFQFDRREPVGLERMPNHLIKAFTSAEDWSFFSHHGISWKGMLRSCLVNLYHRRIVQGASTITQQLVKLLFVGSQRSFWRKLKEQVVALVIERQFTKEQIIETYLNHVYFGCGIYGVQAASQRFWSKDVSKLTVDEAATLAGIVRSPSNYCPLSYPLSAQKRRNVVLRSMVQTGALSQAAYEELRQSDVLVHPPEGHSCAPHLKEALRVFLEQLVGRQRLYSGGLRIQTTLDSSMQQAAEESFVQQIGKLQSTTLPGVEGALISIDRATGQIRAVVGGCDFTVSQFNRAFQAKRQMGSIFKPLVYAVALGRGMSFSDTAEDEPFELEQGGQVWAPQNSSRTFEGTMTLARALSRSNNIITIKTLLSTGIEPVIAVAQRCGLEGPLLPYPSLALGCVDATPKEVVGVVNIFANGGVYVEPHYLRWIKDEWGTKIWRSRPRVERIFPSAIADQVAKVLMSNMERARKRTPERWICAESLGKTGTTNDSRTCWFGGSTSTLTTVVYVGFDDNASMGKNVFPIRTAFPIWLNFYRLVIDEQSSFYFDRSLRERRINAFTGREATKADRESDVMTILV